MVVVSGLFGAISGASGAIVSATGNSLPTGPLTVLAATLLFALSLLFGPKRGILIRRMVQQRMKRSLGYGYEEQAATASVDDRMNKEASL
jgi:manganese/zinc/iron transport system permease protein